MNEAEKAYQAAQNKIARVAKAGGTHLSLDLSDFYGNEPFGVLERLLPELTELKGLRSLRLDGTQVSDLAPLAALTGLRSLRLDDTQVSDLAPLAALTGLQELNLKNTRVSDLAPLAALTGLRELILENTRVSSLAPLGGLTGLLKLDVDNTQVSDLAPLAALTSLQSLYFNRTQVIDLRPVARLTHLGDAGATNGLFYRFTRATERDARLSAISRIEDPPERARETLAYLRTLPPWPESYTPEATPDGSPPQPIGRAPIPPEQDPALPLVWSEQGFTFRARSVASDPVTEAALAELRDLLEELRRKGNRHDDLYRLATILLERSAGEVADLNMVSLHLSFQRLRRVYDNREAREDRFDAETVTTLEAVLNAVPGVTFADEGVRTLNERQKADRDERRSAAETEAETRMLEAVQRQDSPFALVVQETARETLRPGVDDRLSGTRVVLALNAMVVVVSSVAVKIVDDAVGGVIGNFAYEHGAALLAQAAAVSWDAFVWAQSILAKFRVEYEIAIGIMHEAASNPRPRPGSRPKGDNTP
ncbi:MAG: leucine-rich repeat domain-containing protein [Pikeienuella sp.]|uniref:leucine-rich repeat domain-containing protein n=1 Tax=Pikeienuella sp. TaxID=2831957 RepID=UPI00391CBF18